MSKQALSNGDTIGISDFVRRQTPESQFSHYIGSDDRLLESVCENFDKAKPGYRDGVVLVPVSPTGFFSSVVALKEGDVLQGVFQPRQEGEEPRKKTWVVGGKKIPAQSVDIVLYRLDVLQENDEQTPGLDATWEIISINASPTEGEMPIPTGALIANHFQLSGGTATNLTNDEFVELLRKSVEFWKDKALAAPSS